MAEDIDNAIRQNAQGPESAEVNGVKVKQHPLSDQIAADKRLAGRWRVCMNHRASWKRCPSPLDFLVSSLRL